MHSQLINKMARDLNIKRFSFESVYEFHQRLLFSALSEWCRYLVLGESYDDMSHENDITSNTVDIIHVQYRLAQVIEALLVIIPCNDTWLKGAPSIVAKEKLANKIIKDSIFCEQVIKSQSRRLTFCATESVYINRFEFYNWPVPDYKKKEYMRVGLGQWKLKEDNSINYCDHFGLNLFGDLKNYCNSLEKSAVWEEIDLVEDYVLYNPYKKYLWAWKKLNQDELPKGLYLLKHKNDHYRFLLLKKYDNLCVYARLNEIYIKEGEQYRIMYALKHFHKQKCYFKVNKYEDYYVLNCCDRLPYIERKMINLLSWPYTTYDDEQYRIIPSFLLEECRVVLENLGIELEMNE